MSFLYFTAEAVQWYMLISRQFNRTLSQRFARAATDSESALKKLRKKIEVANAGMSTTETTTFDHIDNNHVNSTENKRLQSAVNELELALRDARESSATSSSVQDVRAVQQPIQLNSRFNRGKHSIYVQKFTASMLPGYVSIDAA